METIELAAQKRNTSLRARVLRREGLIPGEIYGGGKKNVSVSFNYQDFRRAYLKAGENTLLTLSLGEGEPYTVLINDVQLDPVSGLIWHVDLMNVRMDQVVHTRIPLEFVGVSLAVKDMSGTLLTSISELEVKCLPKDLVHSIKVDISPLVDFHTTIHVKDIPVPSGIQILNELRAMVVTAVPPLKEEEFAPVPAEGVPVEGAVAADGTATPGAIPAEGAAPATTGVATAPVADKKDKKDKKK